MPYRFTFIATYMIVYDFDSTTPHKLLPLRLLFVPPPYAVTTVPDWLTLLYGWVVTYGSCCCPYIPALRLRTRFDSPRSTVVVYAFYTLPYITFGFYLHYLRPHTLRWFVYALRYHYGLFCAFVCCPHYLVYGYVHYIPHYVWVTVGVPIHIFFVCCITRLHTGCSPCGWLHTHILLTLPGLLPRSFPLPFACTRLRALRLHLCAAVGCRHYGLHTRTVCGGFTHTYTHYPVIPCAVLRVCCYTHV